MLREDATPYEGNVPVGMRPLRIDPCRGVSSFSWARFFFFALLFLTMVPGSILLLIFYRDRPFGVEFATLICYSYAVVLYTFSSGRASGNRYLFSCPWVRRELPRLALRHVAFLIALFVLQSDSAPLSTALVYVVADPQRPGAHVSLCGLSVDSLLGPRVDPDHQQPFPSRQSPP